MCVSVHVCVGTLRGQKAALGALELEVQVVGSGNSTRTGYESIKREPSLQTLGSLLDVLILFLFK